MRWARRHRRRVSDPPDGIRWVIALSERIRDLNQMNTSVKSNKAYGYLITAFAAFCYAWQGTITKLLLAEGVQAIDVVTGLALCGAVIIDAYVLARGKGLLVIREMKENLPVLLGMGLGKFGINFGTFLALRTMSVGLVSVVYYTSPAFVCIFFMITKLKSVGLMNKVAVLITISGCLLALDILHTPLSEYSVPGILLSLFSAISCGTYTVLTDLKGRHLDFLTITAGALTVNALLAVLVNPGFFIRLPSFTVTVAMLFFCQAFVTKILSIIAETRGVLRIGAEKATVVLVLEMPFTLLNAYLVLHETMTPIQLSGVGLIILSVLLLQKTGKETA